MESQLEFRQFHDSAAIFDPAGNIWASWLCSSWWPLLFQPSDPFSRLNPFSHSYWMKAIFCAASRSSWDSITILLSSLNTLLRTVQNQLLSQNAHNVMLPKHLAFAGSAAHCDLPVVCPTPTKSQLFACWNVNKCVSIGLGLYSHCWKKAARLGDRNWKWIAWILQYELLHV